MTGYNKGSRHTEAGVSEMIAAPPERVWALIGDFGRLDWLPDTEITAEGKGVGAMRYSHQADGSVVAERMEAFDPEGMSYSYSIADGALPFSGYKATITVSPAGNGGARVDWTATFIPAAEWPEGKLEHLIRKMYGKGLKEAKRRLET